MINTGVDRATSSSVAWRHANVKAALQGRLRRDWRITAIGAERKTGVKYAEVVTARLVQDERGWLRLAG